MTNEMTQENMQKAYDAFLQKQNIQGAIQQILNRIDQESKAGSNSFETGVIVNRGFQQKEFLWRAFMLTVATFILCIVFEGFGLLPRTPFTLLVAPILGAIASMVITKFKIKQNKKMLTEQEWECVCDYLEDKGFNASFCSIQGLIFADSDILRVSWQ